jgi:hypothetical protein
MIGHLLAWADMGRRRLITRRSRVQIPPPPPTKSPIQKGFPVTGSPFFAARLTSDVTTMSPSGVGGPGS